MRVEYINPFVESSVQLIEEILGDNITRREITLKNNILPILDMGIVIGLTGQVYGKVIIDMNTDTALYIVSIMNGEQFSEINDMAVATLTELANIITGRAVTNLSNIGYQFDVTPPAYIYEGSLKKSDCEKEAILIPLETKYGIIEINITLKEK